MALTVSHLDESARWYSDLFDLAVIRREESGERRAVVLAAPGDVMQIGLVQHAGTGARPFDPTVIGLDHVAWSVANREELDAWENLLREKGIVHSPVADLGSVAILNLKDPDGIALALFWDQAHE